MLPSVSCKSSLVLNTSSTLHLAPTPQAAPSNIPEKKLSLRAKLLGLPLQQAHLTASGPAVRSASPAASIPVSPVPSPAKPDSGASTPNTSHSTTNTPKSKKGKKTR